MRRIPFEVGLIVLVLFVNLYAVLLPANSLVMDWFSSDDAFYYFKSAQNIAEGRGITFDGLGRDSGFHPLWMAMITPIFSLARFDRILPLRVVVFLSALISAGTAALLYRLARRILTPWVAVFIALFWAFLPFIHTQVTEMGMESGISAFFIVLLIYHAARQDTTQPDGRLWQALRTGVIAALTILARLDNIFLVLLVGIWVALRPAQMRYLVITDISITGLGVLWSYMARVGFGPQYAQSSTSAYWMLIAALAIQIPMYYLFNLYRLPGYRWKPVFNYLLKAVTAVLLASAVLSGIMLLLQAIHAFNGFPRLVLVYDTGFQLVAVILTRLIAVFLTRKNERSGETLEWRSTILRLTGYYLPIIVTLILYMGFSQWYFGSPMPVSGQIKRWWGTLPNPIYGRPVESVVGLLGFFPNGGPWGLARVLISWPARFSEWSRFVIYGGMSALILFFWRERVRKAVHLLALFPLFAGSFIQLISYTGTGYLHMRGWYWVSDMLLITLLVGVLADSIVCWSRHIRLPIPSYIRDKPVHLASLLPVLLSLTVVLYGSADLVRRMPMVLSPRMAGFYLESIHELEASTEPGSIIGSTGGGVVAYFLNGRTVVNLDGLMNTVEYFHLLKSGKASQYLSKIGMDYVYAGEYAITSSDPYFQFASHLVKLRAFGGSTLFRWER